MTSETVVAAFGVIVLVHHNRVNTVGCAHVVFLSFNYMTLWVQSAWIRYQCNLHRNGPGWGLPSLVFQSVISPVLQIQTNFYMFNITFIFFRCRRSWAAAAPVNYEYDSNNQTGIFARTKISMTEKLAHASLVAPDSRMSSQNYIHLQSNQWVV